MITYYQSQLGVHPIIVIIGNLRYLIRGRGLQLSLLLKLCLNPFKKIRTIIILLVNF